MFADARTIKLEQNYRSTQNILNAANDDPKQRGQKRKDTLTDNEEGDLIHFRQFLTAFDEAEYIVGDIAQNIREGNYEYKDCAILYRTNAQSRMFEEKFLMANIPYKIIGA